MKYKPVMWCMSRGCDPQAIIEGAGYSDFAELYAEANPTQALVDRLGARKNGKGWIARCSAEGHEDSRASLHISEGTTPITDRYSNGNTPKIYETVERAIAAAVWRLNRDGGDWRHVAPAFTYHHADGRVAFKVARFDNGAGADKQFRPLSPVDGGWVLRSMSGRRPLYRLPEIGSGRVFVCEGEKCADLARSIGLNATTSAHGSKSPHKTDWTPLAGRKVCILPDADEPGRKYAQTVAGILSKLDPPADVRIIKLPDIGVGNDIVQFCDEARDSQTTDQIRDEIEALADATAFPHRRAARRSGQIRLCRRREPSDPHRHGRDAVVDHVQHGAGEKDQGSRPRRPL